METLWQDVRYGARTLRRQPGFSLIAILTLGLGIGATAALFSVIDAALLRPLPYSHPEQLMSIDLDVPQRDRRLTLGPSLIDARLFRNSPVVASVAVGRNSRSLIVDAGQAERIPVQEMSEGYLDVYQVRPRLGRPFSEEDLVGGAPPVAMLSYTYWQRRFGTATDVIGRTITIEGDPTIIVGVLPEGFQPKTDLWRPLRLEPRMQAMRGAGTSVIARLREGVTQTMAEQELTDRLRQAGAVDTPVKLTSLLMQTTRGARSTAKTLAGGVGLLLLIACVNVAGLLLAQGSRRAAELAVRASLGAGRGRLIRQLMVENIVLTTAGTLAGLALAWLSLDAIVSLIPIGLSPAGASVNLVVLALTTATAIGTSLLVGLVPAWRLSRASLTSSMGSGNRSGSPLSRRSGQLLIASEVALAIILLAGAGVLVRSFERLVSVDLGFQPDAVTTMEVAPLKLDSAVISTFYPELLEKVRALPGVQSAGAIDFAPLVGGSMVTSAKGASDARVTANTQHVLPGYFEAMGIQLRAGRFLAKEDRGAPHVVIDEASAAQLFPGGSAVGQTFTLMNSPVIVVGVVHNVKHWGAETSRTRPNIYAQVEDTNKLPLLVVLRMNSTARLSPDSLRDLATSIGPPVLVERIRPGGDLLDDNVATPRKRTVLISLLGSLGLLLTLIGIASVTAYAVTRRTHEIGVRMAFGADAGSVVRTMMRDATWPVGVGLVLGLGAAFYATRFVASFLFETTPTDPITFAAVAALLAVAATWAAWVPARRAARVDPVQALRGE